MLVLAVLLFTGFNFWTLWRLRRWARRRIRMRAMAWPRPERLATMSVIAREIEAELPVDSPLREEAVLLCRQLALCRDILQGLRAQAAGELPRQPLSTLVGHAVRRMEVMYPARAFALTMALPDRLVQAPATLPQVLVNGRAEGLGIGYFLSNASVNQWGGSIRLQPRGEGGTLTPLRLPWTVLQPGPLPAESPEAQ